jgi:hypothetical protein
MIQEIQALKSKACQTSFTSLYNNTQCRTPNLLEVSLYMQEGMLKAANEILQEKVSICDGTLIIIINFLQVFRFCDIMVNWGMA